MALAGDHSKTSQDKLWHGVGKWQDKKPEDLSEWQVRKEKQTAETFALHLGEHAAAERGRARASPES